MRWPNWRGALMPARAWCRCWASAAPARHGWQCDLPAPGWVTFPVVCGSATCRRRARLDGMLHAVAQALDVPLGHDDPVLQLGHAIAATGNCLVILDNFEQVARHADDTLGRWLDRAGRGALPRHHARGARTAGEEATGAAAAWRRPMRRRCSTPRGDRRDRISSRVPTHERGDVPQLVRLLDGLPLAIELAAARVRVMSPQAAAGIAWVSASSCWRRCGGRSDRQATLRAAFDWSWDLLVGCRKGCARRSCPSSRAAFTLEAAEAGARPVGLPG